MDAHSYKCPGCGGALLYDIKSKKLLCDFCCEAYDPEEVPAPVRQEKTEEAGAYEEQQLQEGEASYAEDDSAYMKVRIYHCGSCGAEIMTNDVEVAKMCSYCGQPAILFDRVSRERRPAKIIPFRLDKKQAVEKAKEQFAGAKFMPVAAKNISVDNVHAIYFPYYCYDASMKLRITVTARGNNGKIVRQKQGSLRRNVLLDVSEKFNDDVAKALNPFPVKEAVPFQESYLSGFYADRCDVDVASRKADAEKYVQTLLQEKLIAQVPEAPSLNMRQQYAALYEKTGFSCEVEEKSYELNGSEYFFCPIYFITFKVGKKLVILLVNGSTGKVIGNVPIDETAFAASQKRNSIFGAVVGGFVGAMLFRFMPVFWAGGLFAILAFSSIATGINAKRVYEKMQKEMSSEAMFDLTKNREK